MGKSYSPQQIVRYLREAEGKLASCSTIPEVAREIGVSETTFHCWKKLCRNSNGSSVKGRPATEVLRSRSIKR